MNYYFLGICGIGMSGIAYIIKKMNLKDLVIGSDRFFDNNKNLDIKNKLEKNGIIIVPQNLEVYNKYKIDLIVVSTAISDDLLEIKEAKKRGIKIIHRSELLNEIVKKYKHSIAISGTSGKSTITALIGYIFYVGGKEPTIINGAIMNNFKKGNMLGNAIKGKNKNYVIFEADESDGSFLNYKPETAIISNISLDHQEITKLKELFFSFSKNVNKNLIINSDCENSNSIKFNCKKKIYKITKNKIPGNIKELKIEGLNISFKYKGNIIKFRYPGYYNLLNILFSIKVAEIYKIKKEAIIKALNTYKGLYRRFDIKLKEKNYLVLDDYAHNPDKIENFIQTITKLQKRNFFIFQPHGFGPTNLMFEGYVNTFLKNIKRDDYLILLPVFYAGGKINKIRDSYSIYKELKKNNFKNVYYIKERKKVIEFIKKKKIKNSVIAVFGARDNSLNDFANEIAKSLIK
ncbi:MAG TPA: Mur ligase domain-containing protein [bacterium]|nr:Mur ligase domain-containing protein [bacterium]HOL47492.1 Mur ligase domain-containing protein [bacterium]HPQ19586.1 Mur ligase domain-containing protein [bacterium]